MINSKCFDTKSTRAGNLHCLGHGPRCRRAGRLDQRRTDQNDPVDTGVVYNAVFNSDGIYTFPSLPIGAYTFEATVSGFQTYVQCGIQLRVNDQVQININMKVGAVAERVEVQANAEMVQTQQNTNGSREVPLNGRRR
jgi:Carboxypeptidase regulatory-like domain